MTRAKRGVIGFAMDTIVMTPAQPRPRVLLFPASLRRQSCQRRLVDYLSPRLAERCELDLLEPGSVELPLFNQDLEDDPGLRDTVAALHHRIALADALVIASPEYNGTVAPFLKNTVDWISRLPRIDSRFSGDRAFQGKLLLLATASTGWTGGTLGLQAARDLFAYLGSLVVGDQICVAAADHWTREGAFHFEPPFAEHIDAVLMRFITLVETISLAHPGPGERTLVGPA